MDKNKHFSILFVLVITLLCFSSVAADGAFGQYYVQDGYTCGYQGWCGNSCCYQPQPLYDRADFISDVTISDGSYVSPGTSFTKTWRLRNAGTSTWNTNYRLVFRSGNQMGALSSINLPYNVAPGQTIDLSVLMTAPASSGSYRGNWILQNDRGSYFGVGQNGTAEIYVLISTAQNRYQPCTGWNCDKPCTGWNCDQPCTGWNCNRPCTGWNCNQPYQPNRPYQPYKPYRPEAPKPQPRQNPWNQDPWWNDPWFRDTPIGK